ncbi:MAG: hypothetical protein IPH78_13995 [Bacteroidetes bacterium]|nr:hypothetical protein [Bacteroidota bacterium]
MVELVEVDLLYFKINKHSYLYKLLEAVTDVYRTHSAGVPVKINRQSHDVKELRCIGNDLGGENIISALALRHRFTIQLQRGTHRLNLSGCTSVSFKTAFTAGWSMPWQSPTASFSLLLALQIAGRKVYAHRYYFKVFQCKLSSTYLLACTL